MSTADPAPVVLEQVSVSIGGRPILRDVDLSVGTGDTVTLLGPNGSGKSTLVRAVTGLLPHTRGTVRLFGTPIQDFTDWQRIGFVPQRSTATGGVPATVREVVASGRVGRRKLLRPTSRADRRAVESALEVVGLADRSSYGVSQLSGGQQQRVLIARALAGEPELLVLDEPTAGVDLPHQQALADALGRLKAQGATILLVAHEIGPMMRLIDRSVVMRDGLVAYDGPPLTQEVAAHTHHAHDHDDHHDHGVPGGHDHAPHVSSPLDFERGHHR
ncbi:metal ABC transporter ATP-binding protein [Nocardioides hwasunensis]|uniref:ABC transporter ATP-binding protein n=1 Tax=Nocardioides hwasunensis TaxID=397258 RepID=A0ABR8MJJ3_9ACTN|nr:ABC transporter ATP-binding protein [Nocardioides hwasunensis]MBD3916157.1 ABC transporter ATP-binding protein [Nocardioides hwasunensis]